nr:d4.1 [Tranosema rostrale ichnovirus]
MLNGLSTVRGLLKVQSILIDNSVFRLHYKITVVVLLAFSLITTSGQFFGDPMDCYFPDYPSTSLNTYCYIQSTFLVARSATHAAGKGIPHPGLTGHTEEDTLKFYGYYQWVFITLFVQAIFFYAPHYIWKASEGGTMKMLAIDIASPVVSAECIRKNTEPLVEYFCTTLRSHNSYAYKYFLCEVLNLINIIGQICFINAFIGEEFRYYGIYVLIFKWKEQLKERMTNPMEEIFPTVTKCSYKTYGPSGSLQNREGICVLAQNSVNQKIYVFLWFWFNILAIISALVIIYRIVTIIFPSIRVYEFRSSSKMNRARDINVVVHKLRIGDWFLMRMLQQNINSLAYRELIFCMAQRFDSGVCSSCLKPLSMLCVNCAHV